MKVEKLQMLRAIITLVFRTQADFAAHLGTDQARISEILTGRKALTRAKAERWAEALGVPLSEIFEEG